MPYRIIYSRPARSSLRLLTARERSLIARAVEEQLVFQPDVRTRNRKPMAQTLVGDWELRIRHLRVFYTIEKREEATVSITAIGVKVGNQILIDGREANLRAEN